MISDLLPSLPSNGAVSREPPIRRPHQGERSPLSLLAFVRKYRTLLMGGVFFGLVLGSAVHLMQKRIFRAEASLEVQGVNDNFLNLRDVDPTPPPGGIAIEPYIQTQAEIIQSNVVVDRVIDQLRMLDRSEYALSQNPLDRARSLFGRLKTAKKQDQGDLRRSIRANLTVGPEKQSNIIQIGFDSPDPILAATFVNTLIDEYVRQGTDVRSIAAEQIHAFLGKDLEELRLRAQQSDQALQTYAMQSGLATLSGGETLAQGELKELQPELIRARADRIAKQALWDTIRQAPPDSIPETVDNGTLKDYQIKLTDLRKELAALTTLLQPENYKVVRVQQQIDELTRALNAEVQNTKQRVESELKTAELREAALRDVYDQQARLVKDQSAKAVRYHMLERESTTDNQIYESMLQQAKQAAVAAGLRPPTVRIIGRANQPSAPYKPKFVLDEAIGTFAGLWLGIGLAFAAERSNQRLSVPGDAKLLLNVPELGAIPNAHHAPILLGNGRFADALKLPVGSVDFHQTSEVFRNLAASLAAGREQERPRIIVFTSAWPAEGKTTVLSNLGVALAETGRNVVLVDCDVRRPRLQGIFNVPNSWGLKDLLADQKGMWDVPIRSLVKQTGIQRLFLLPSGAGVTNVPELLYSARVRPLLTRLREEFDYVLVDTPAMLSFADARIVARNCEAAILVHRANLTTIPAALSVLETLAVSGTPILGAVLNDCTPSLVAYKPEKYSYFRTPRAY
jgi:succinoglycan biosynthesis transport protein ExoP